MVLLHLLLKSLADVNEVDADGNALLDEDGNQVVTRGVKYNLKQEVKAQQGSLLSQTDWVVVRKADNDMQYQLTLQHGEQLSELKLQRWKQQ